MLTLYVLPGCPYCAKVLMAGAELSIDFNEKNIEDDNVAQELKQRGGKVLAPYLVDEEKNVEMYESDDIVAYLHERFGKD